MHGRRPVTIPSIAIETKGKVIARASELLIGFIVQAFKLIINDINVINIRIFSERA